ncbi:hypothetical protein DPMN_085834 [Dreissena polymorpha]|uniref:Uncharacterized protein n=1 Tax=Dreissena polymorpha TaxID=45954 RepID=A0A9D3YDE5_DREPO|nr:hypothetical protein DPMN_085834 [Dreissena polymorpha]
MEHSWPPALTMNSATHFVYMLRQQTRCWSVYTYPTLSYRWTALWIKPAFYSIFTENPEMDEVLRLRWTVWAGRSCALLLRMTRSAHCQLVTTAKRSP